jgi:hypothetical protein
MAVLRNLRLMRASGVDPKLICERLAKGVARELPFRFVTAARHAPKMEEALEADMLMGIAGFAKPLGSTGLVVDVSRSMDSVIAKKSETTRMDAAAGLAILLREKAEEFSVATFSEACVEIPPRRGFALRDGITGEATRSGDCDYRRAVARRNPPGVDAEGRRGERGAVQARRELRQQVDACGRMVRANCGLHRSNRGGSCGVRRFARRDSNAAFRFNSGNQPAQWRDPLRHFCCGSQRGRTPDFRP